jgi:hypothetical protein
MWTQIASFSPISPNQESWRVYPLEGNGLELAYGFRPVVSPLLPVTWQWLGHWAFLYTSEGQSVMSQTLPIPYLNGANPQPIRVISPEEVYIVGGQVVSLNVMVFFHSWVPVTALQVYALYED